MKSETHTESSDNQADQKLYWAFISYSSKDRKWGEWLHRRLENYPIPAEFRGLEVFDGAVLGKNLRPIFRDRDELASSADLGAAILKALDASRFLVVLCSKNAAKSQWVNKEIEDFQALGKGGRILALILDGEPNANAAGKPDEECFPPALRYPAEPIAGDLRKEGDGKERGFLKVLAGIAQLDFDKLYRRHERAMARKRLVAGAVALTLITAFAGLSIFAWSQQQAAEKNARQAQERKLQAEASAERAREQERQAVAEKHRADANARETRLSNEVATREKTRAEREAEQAITNLAESYFRRAGDALRNDELSLGMCYLAKSLRIKPTANRAALPLAFLLAFRNIPIPVANREMGKYDSHGSPYLPGLTEIEFNAGGGLLRVVEAHLVPSLMPAERIWDPTLDRRKTRKSIKDDPTLTAPSPVRLRDGQIMGAKAEGVAEVPSSSGAFWCEGEIGRMRLKYDVCDFTVSPNEQWLAVTTTQPDEWAFSGSVETLKAHLYLYDISRNAARLTLPENWNSKPKATTTIETGSCEDIGKPAEHPAAFKDWQNGRFVRSEAGTLVGFERELKQAGYLSLPNRLKRLVVLSALGDKVLYDTRNDEGSVFGAIPIPARKALMIIRSARADLIDLVTGKTVGSDVFETGMVYCRFWRDSASKHLIGISYGEFGADEGGPTKLWSLTDGTSSGLLPKWFSSVHFTRNGKWVFSENPEAGFVGLFDSATGGGDLFVVSSKQSHKGAMDTSPDPSPYTQAGPHYEAYVESMLVEATESGGSVPEYFCDMAELLAGFKINGKGMFEWIDNSPTHLTALRSIVDKAPPCLYRNIAEWKLADNEQRLSSPFPGAVKATRLPSEPAHTAGDTPNDSLIPAAPDNHPSSQPSPPPSVNAADAIFQQAVAAAKDESPPGNKTIAYKLFRRAAEMGHPIAQHRIGVAYATGGEVEKDDTEAVKWYILSANQGYAEAQFDLGVRYILGKGVSKDEAKGVEFYRKSAKQRYAPAIELLEKRGIRP